NATTNATTTPAATTTTTATTTTEVVTSRRMSFRSATETFTNDLLNSSSTSFINRASLLKKTLEPFYRNSFSTFRSLNVVSFSSGSIINNMDLNFASSSVPNNTAIGNVLISAASNITAFNIDPTSVSVNGTQVSGGVSHKISLITASCLVLLSWLLTSQQ
ncbi:Y' element ATP-dependent helicase YPR204W-like, partial [Parambassis ranga]|uniref:Y' element ATP-dependent helicase YPR204W-like n=1 Tax=Parambassis ranga TaxID=210632 RepID=A0A6P7K830_9TELE